MKKYIFYFFFCFLLIGNLISQTNLEIEELSPLQNARVNHVQIVPSSNKFVFIGGHINGFLLTKSVEIFDYSTKTWTSASSVDNRDFSFCTRLLNGNYLIGGGMSSSYGVGQLATTEIYDPKNDVFTAAANMNAVRAMVNAATLSDGRVLISGNWYSSAAQAEVYDTASNSYTTTGSLIVERSYPFIFPTNDGGAVVFGTSGPMGTASANVIEKFNPTDNTFSEITRTLFDGVTSWSIGSGKSFNYVDSELPDGKYVVPVSFNNGDSLKIITIDPVTSQISELSTNSPIPVYDDESTSLKYIGNGLALVDKQNKLIHLVQNAYSVSHTLRIVTINIETGSVNWSKMGEFDFYTYTANVSMLEDGRILFSGGNKPDNFTLSPRVFIIKVPDYSETGINQKNKTQDITVLWSTETNSITLNEDISDAAIYDLKGIAFRCSLINNRQIECTNLEKGIYILKVKSMHNNQIYVTKFIRP